MAMTLTSSYSPPISPSSSTANKSMEKIIVIVLIVILMTFFNSTLNDVTKNVQKHHEIYYEKQHQDYYYQQQQKLQAFENANPPNENETTTRTTKPITKAITEVVPATAANNSNDEAPPPYYQQQEQQQPSATATKAITTTTEKSEAAAAAGGGGGGIAVTTETTSQSPSSSSSFSWPYPDYTPDDIWIYWIHVGKAGGVSLRDGLPISVGQKKVLRSCMMKYVATATKTTTTTTTNNSNIANRPDDNTTTTTNNATTTNATTTTTTSMTMTMTMKDANTKCYPSSSQKGGTALSKHILAGFHMWGGQYDDTEKNWVLENTNALLFSVRNPIDRIISAYGYHYNEYFTLSKWEINHNVSLVDKIEKNKQSRRVASQFYFDCFPSLDDLCLSMVQYYHFHHPLLNDTTTVNNTTGNNTKPALSEQCMDLGRRILEGWNSGRYLPHFNYNYRSYLQRTYYYSDNNQQKRQQRPRHGKIIMTTNERRRRPRPPPRRHDVVVIRTEHMWNDTAKLDIVLGGNGTKDFIKPNHQHTHNSQTLSVERRKISQDLLINSNSSSSNGNHYSSLPKIAICCAIYKDLDAYQAIVLLAKNLNIEEKQQTLQLLFDDCGGGGGGGIKAPLPPILFRPDDDNDSNDNGSYSASYFSWQEWYDSTCLLK